ncbi:MAG: ShlB/FhaC/HecB family hemolysin secretion/activation protein [Pseudomonadota bacterium]
MVWAAALGPGVAAAQNFLPPVAHPNIPPLETLEVEDLGDVTITLPGGTRPPTGAGGVSFQLNGLDIRGATAFTGEDLAPIFADRLGSDVTLNDLFGFVAEIERTYRDAGFILSYAFLPPQESEDGVFAIEVVEGFVNSVTFEDVDDPELLAQLQPRFDALIAERPVTAESLEAALMSANSGLGGFSVSGVLQPAEEGRGGSDLIVMAEQATLDAVVGVNNRGTDYAGPNRLQGDVRLYNLGVLGDRFSAALDLTQPGGEQTSLAFSYARPVDWIVPLIVNASVAGAWANPGADLEPFDVSSRTLSFDLSARADVHRSLDDRATVTGGVDWRKVNTKTALTQIARDRIGSIYVEAGYTYAGLFGGGSAVTLRVERGLPFLNTADAGDPRSRIDAEHDYTVVKLRAAHRQPIWGNFSALLGLTAQYSFDPLFASKEFALGGSGFGRGYDVGEAIGDHGAAGTLELRYDLIQPVEWLPRVQPYVFVDGGATFNIGDSDGQALASTGGGLRFTLPYDIELDVEMTYAFGPEPDLDYDLFGRDLGRSRVFFALRKGFSL